MEGKYVLEFSCYTLMLPIIGSHTYILYACIWQSWVETEHYSACTLGQKGVRMAEMFG